MPEGESSEISTIDHEANLKNKRKQVRGRITRSIKRLNEGVSKKETNLRRFEKELEQLRKDFDVAHELHSQFYDLPDLDAEILDKWEDDLTNDVYGIEEIVEEYIRSALKSNSETSGENAKNFPQGASKQQLPETTPQAPSSSQTSTPEASTSTAQQEEIQEIPLPSSNMSSSMATTSSAATFDSWIDELKEFEETKLASNVDGSQISVAEALLKLEASRDIPNITLMKFSGDPLDYADFIDRFKIHIHDKSHLNDDMRMIQLKMHVGGDAERAISGLGSKGIMYATALRTIKEQFGQPSVIARALVNNLTKGEKIGRSDRKKLREFSIDLMTCMATMKRIGYTADINANENLRKIVVRLPDHMIEKWRVFVADIREKGQTPTVHHITEFVKKRVKAEFDPDFGDLQRDSRIPKNEPLRKGIYATDRDSKKSSLKCYVCEEDHRVVECPVIMKASVPERLELAKKARLCFSCLNRGHSKNECRSKKKCEKSDSCPYFHHTLLHSNPPNQPPVGNVIPVNAAQPGVASVLDKASMMPVVRARFRAPNGRVREGNVLIDSGAGTTVIRKQFSKDLGLNGRREQIDLAVVGGEKLKQPHSRRVNFWISALEGDREFKIEAHEIDKTIVNVPEVDRKWLSSFPHLKDIEFHHISGPIDLILGVHYTHLHAEEEIRQGKEFQPVAKKTKLGWYVMGANDKKRTSECCSIHFVRKINMEKFYEFETLGVQAVNCSCPKPALSLDDKRAMELMEQSCKLENDRYVIGLPWKKDKSLLPDNRPLAETRLRSLEKSLSKNNEKARMYDEVISQYTANNWAIPLSEEDLKADTKPVYYLPHHGVYRPDKKSTPLRVVFDPASPYHGVSLNSFLFKGPGLIGNLLGVLLRFREEPVAFSGDISKMFLQILLPKEDTHVHRFLWRNLDTTREPTTYALQRVTFGDKPSPDMASFVMLKIAKENEKECPRAATILKRDRYVDDLIHSCPSTDEAVKSMEEVDTVLSTGSFKIKEWICSSTVQKNSECEAPNETDVEMNGPPFLLKPKTEWPNERTAVSEVQIEDIEKRKLANSMAAVTKPQPLLNPKNFSNWEKLIRVTAYCQRFGNNIRYAKKDPSKLRREELKPAECKEAENYWIREAQRELVVTDYPNLSPFIEDGLIRVGSRLNKSQLPYEQVNPVLLPKHHHVSSLIMESAHVKVKHAGRERTLCESRAKYWIIGGRQVAKNVTKNCVVCRRVRQPPHSTLMGNLPQDRVKVHAPPFTVTGVDLFGPFLLKYGRNKSIKAWGAIFTCATSRAVHLEIVENASAEAFLQALRRFASHHGWPETVISDNGGSFVGAEVELRKLFLEGKKRLTDFAVLHKIHWKFITPLSPHQGGMYESLIKVTKRALRMSTGEQILSWNEMATIFAEVKSIVNSRPLTYLSDDPNDLRPLTPNHLLLGRASADVPHGPYEDTNNTHKRFQYVQTLVNNFWKRFITEYIPKLIATGRSKWQKKESQIKKDDIVLIVENNVPRGKWNLGRVLEVFPGKDGIVRNVRLKTENGELKRSIQKCCILLETK